MRKVLDLMRRLESRPERADAELDAFVKQNAFPIVEDVTATFFVWSRKPAESVYLIHWVFGLESRQEFQRIPNTQAFYLPIELPLTARVEYKLEIHRPGGKRELVRDPLNPRQAFDPFGSNSVCPMPGYHEPQWCQQDNRARPGRLESIELDSVVWGGKRTIDVYLPNEYKPHKRYPLLLCHDGEDYRKFAAMRRVLDNLIHRHEVAPLIVAFTNGYLRNEEYAANPKQAKFLVEEVLPAVTARYSISEGPEQRGLMGASFGGVSSLFTAWTYPGVFGRLLLQSGSFRFTDVGRRDDGPLWAPIYQFVNSFRSDPHRISARVFMSCGTFESLIYYNRCMLPVLRDAGLAVRYVESQDGHNWINWRDRLRDGLTFLYPGHLWMYYE
jgi:enterochelin esterase-like enzyme